MLYTAEFKKPSQINFELIREFLGNAGQALPNFLKKAYSNFTSHLANRNDRAIVGGNVLYIDANIGGGQSKKSRWKVRKENKKKEVRLKTKNKRKKRK